MKADRRPILKTEPLAPIVSETKLDIRVVTVTPELAQDWLKKNPSNRPLRSAALGRYSRDMAAGRWQLHGQAIHFDQHGNLLDGQHRLVACIMAGASFQTLVICGLASETIGVLDSGIPRKLSDYLHWRGQSDALALAAIIRLSWLWENDQLGSWGWALSSPTIQEGMAWFDANPQVAVSISASRLLRKGALRVPSSAGGAFHFRASKAWPSETESFIKVVAEGAGLEEGNPAFAYRRFLENLRDGPPRNQREHLAYIVKAFTAWVAGDSVRLLKWQPSTSRFPQLPEPPGVKAA